MKVVILGLPGAGKGTQAKKLSREYDVPHISMGDILRNNKGYETESGKTVGEIIDAGNPVSVETSSSLLERRLDEPDCEDGFVLDGFPRTGGQAEAMDDIADIDAIVLLEVDEENIFERLTNRRICPECGDQYHLKFDPPEDDELCDECGEGLIQREDDTRERIEERIKWQREGLEEIKDHYGDRDVIVSVDGNSPIEEVWEDLQEAVEDHV